MISKDTIADLKAKLQAEHDQHIAASNQSISNANAVKGALQACDHLLSLPDATIEPCCGEGEGCSSNDCTGTPAA